MSLVGKRPNQGSFLPPLATSLLQSLVGSQIISTMAENQAGLVANKRAAEQVGMRGSSFSASSPFAFIIGQRGL